MIEKKEMRIGTGRRFNAACLSFLISAVCSFAHADFRIITGTFTMSGTNTLFDSSGSIVIDGGGVIDAGDSGLRLTGSWEKSGGFVQGTSTVTFYNVMTSSMAGNTTFYVLRCVEPGKMLQFQGGSTQAVTSNITLTGTSGALIKLRPVIGGTTWSFSFPNSVQTADYVDVQNSSAMLNNVVANNSANSGGNNNRWLFGGMPTPPYDMAQYAGDFIPLPWGGWTQYRQVRATFTLSDPTGDNLKFNIQFSSYPDFATFLFIDSTSPAVATLTSGQATNYISSLLPEGTWYWRVMGIDINGDGSSFSSGTVVGGIIFGVDYSSPTEQGISQVAPWISSVTVTVVIASDVVSGLYSSPNSIRFSTATEFTTAVSTISGWFSGSSTQTFTGLSPNTTYYFQTRARDNALNISSWTAGTVSTFTRATLANAPAGLSFGTVYMTSITVAWGASSPDNPADTLYAAQLSSTNFGSGTIYSSITFRGMNSAVIENLAVDTTYYGRVIAFNRDGAGSTATLTSPSWKSTLTNAPAGLSWGAIYMSSLTVNWGASTPDNPVNSSYVVQLSSTNFGAGTIYSSVTLRTLQAAVAENLSPNTTYYARVAALNWNGAGSTTALTSPSSRVTHPNAPASLSWTHAFTSSITVSWGASSPDNPAGTPYAVQLSSTNFGAGIIYSSSVVRSSGAVMVDGLGINTSYYGRVIAKNWEMVNATAAVSSPQSVKVTSATVPTAVAFIIADVGTYSIAFSWTENGNPPGTIYQMNVSTSADFVPYGLNETYAGLSITTSTLSSGTTYHFRVRAKSHEGVLTGWSVSLSTKTLIPPPQPPSPPGDIRNLTAMVGSNAGEVKLFWSAPGEDGMSGNISGGYYKIKYRDDQIANFDVKGTEFASLSTNTVAGQEVGIVVTGLTADTIYYFAIKTRDGSGNWSGWSVANGYNAANSAPARAAQPSGTMYLRGEWNNWEIKTLTKDTNDFHFYAAIPIAAKNSRWEFKLDPSGVWAGNNYGDSDATAVSDGEVGTAEFNAAAGNLEANLNEGQSCWIISFTSDSFQTSYSSYAVSRVTSMALAGAGFTSPAITWTPTDAINRMFVDPDRYYLWYMDVQLTAGTQIQFKFAPNGSWTDPMGKGWSFGDADNTVGPDSQKSTAYFGGSRANLTYTPLRTGQYRIQFNLYTGAYSITPTDDVYIPPVTVQSPGGGNFSTKLIADLYPDKARYSPGESINIYADLTNNIGSLYAGTLTVTVNQYNLEIWRASQPVSLANGNSQTYSFAWTAPYPDFQGYRIDLLAASSTGTLIDRRGSALDVSSEWYRFPRMGFMSDFDDSEGQASIQDKIKTMNKYHISGIMFYDWFWRHEKLIKMTGSMPDRTYEDLFNRVLSSATIAGKITEGHSRNMTAQAYHLLYGAREEYTSYGVNTSWGLFTSLPADMTTQDRQYFTDFNRSIYVMNPKDDNWRSHIQNEYKGAISTYSFDGFHFDQFGYRGTLYSSTGGVIDVDSTYADFLNNTKAALQTASPNVRISFNNVTGYGQTGVLSSNVDMMYREVWNFAGDWEYNDMKTILDNIRATDKPALIAAYMNYDEANQSLSSYFSEASVRLADACIAANGGHHMEIGEGDAMLSNEYFPTRRLVMNDTLRLAMRRHYDFITAYENILVSTDISNNAAQPAVVTGVPSAENAAANNLWVIKKKKDDGSFEMVHLINLFYNDVYWRNFASSPTAINNVKLRYFPAGSNITNVFLASPDQNEGEPYYIPYSTGNLSGYYIDLSVPNIEYWTMITFKVGSDNTAPAAISDLSALVQNGSGEMKLTWTSPGDDGTSGGASGALYRIRYSSFTQLSDFDSLTTPYYQIDLPAGFAPNTPQSYTLAGLNPNVTYYFGIKTRDESGNWSVWSRTGVNPSNSNYAGSFKRLVDGSSADWKGTLPANENSSTISEGEWIWNDKNGEMRTEGTDPDSDYDLREVRVTADTDYLYWYFKYATLTSTTQVHISLSLDNDNISGSGSLWNGDDSAASGSVGLGNDYAGYQLGSEMNIAIHAAASDAAPQIEIYPDPWDGVDWGSPRGSWSVAINTTNAVVEARISRTNLGLLDAHYFRFVVGTYENNVGWCSLVDTTKLIQPLSHDPDLLDTMSIMKPWDGDANRNDAKYDKNAWWEDIEDSDIDFWVKLKVDKDGAISNTPPSTPIPVRPTNGGYTTNLKPALIWNSSFDTDSGDEVTSYLVEFASNAADLGTDLALYRVNVSTLQMVFSWSVPDNLILNKVYYWRAYSRDRTGALSSPSAAQSFTIIPPASFTPMIDGIKETEWEEKAKAESSDFYKTPGNYCRSVYVTNDAGYLYVGWEAQGDPWNDSLSALYSFVFDTGSVNGIMTEPNKSSTTVSWANNKPEAWVNGTVNYGSDDFGSMVLYTTTGTAWSNGTNLTPGTDFKVSLLNSWGEFRIPLKTLGLVTGCTVQYVHLFHPELNKPGASDSTPYDVVGTNDYGNNASNISAFGAYNILFATMDVQHIPNSVPIVGQGTMRYPLDPDSGNSVNIRISVNPQGVFDTGEVRYSTGAVWKTTHTVTFGAASYSGGSEYRTATIPAYSSSTIMKYYAYVPANGMETYIYGPGNGESYITRFASIAIENAWSYTIKNASPTAPTSVALTPAIPSDSDSLYCTALGAADPDGDPLTLIFRWYKDNVLQSTAFMNTVVSTLAASNTSPNEQWFCTCQSSDTSGYVSAVATSNVVAILNQVWVGTAPSKVNVSTLSSGEFIILDKTGDASNSDADLTEARIKFNSDYVYFLLKFRDITSANNPFVAITIDTDSVSGRGSIAAGDGSNLTLGAEYSTGAGTSLGYRAAWEREIIFHSTAAAANSFTAEISSGGNWVLPPPLVSSVSIHTDANLVEAGIKRSELGLYGAFSARFSIATFLNSPGMAQDAITTPGNALDSISIVRISSGSQTGQYTNDPSNSLDSSAEDLSDNDIDYWFELSADAPGNLSGASPTAPFNPLPLSGGATNSMRPSLAWGETVSGAGYDVTGFLLELNNSSNLDDTVLWRVNVSTSHFAIPSNLTGTATFYWRVWARDRRGGVVPSTQVWTFYVDSEEPFANTPEDNQNIDNYGLRSGDEDADGNVYFNWAPVTVSSYAVTNNIIDVSSSTSFDFYISSDMGTLLHSTFTALSRGQYWYARTKAKNTAGITGPNSPISNGIYVAARTIDGNLTDWAGSSLTANMAIVLSSGAGNWGEMVWKDATNDERADGPNPDHLDLSTFALTCDARNLYMYFTFASNTPAGFDGRHFIQVAIDNDSISNERVFQGRNVLNQDVYVSGETPWEWDIRIRSGSDDCRIVDSSFKFQKTELYKENLSANTFEAAIPLADLGGASRFLGRSVNFTVIVSSRQSDGEVGQWGTSISTPHAVDVVSAVTSADPTWDEVKDGIVDFYLRVDFSGAGAVNSVTPVTATHYDRPAEAEISGSLANHTARDWIMYNMFVDHFYNGDPSNDNPQDPLQTGGDFQGVIDKTYWLNQIGINTVYFSALTYFGGWGVWGYDVKDPFRVEDHFGGYYDYMKMIKHLRYHNIKATMDLVPGQATGAAVDDHPNAYSLTKMNFGSNVAYVGQAEHIQLWSDSIRWWMGIGMIGFRWDNPKYWIIDDGKPQDDRHLHLRTIRNKIDKDYPNWYTYGELPPGNELGSNYRNFVDVTGIQLHAAEDFDTYAYGIDPWQGSSCATNDGMNAAVKRWAADSGLTSTMRDKIEAADGAAGQEKVLHAARFLNHDNGRWWKSAYQDLGKYITGYSVLLSQTEVPIMMYGDEICGGGGCSKGVCNGSNWCWYGGGTDPFPWGGGNCSEGSWGYNTMQRIIEARAIFPAMRRGPFSGGRGQINIDSQWSGNLYATKRSASEQSIASNIVIVVNKGDVEAHTIDIPVGVNNTMFEDFVANDNEYKSTSDGTGNLRIGVYSKNVRMMVQGGYSTATLTGVVANLPSGQKAVVDVDGVSVWTRDSDESGNFTVRRILTPDSGTVARKVSIWAPGKGLLNITTTFTNNQVTSFTGGNAITLPEPWYPQSPAGFGGKARDRAVDLWWTPRTEAEAASYHIYYGTKSGGPYNWAGEFLQSPIYFSGAQDIAGNHNVTNRKFDTFLTNGVTYYFIVRTANRDGTKSAFSNELALMPRKVKVRFWLDARSQPGVNYAYIRGNLKPLGPGLNDGNMALPTLQSIQMTNNGDGTFEYTAEIDPTMYIRYRYSLNTFEGIETLLGTYQELGNTGSLYWRQKDRGLPDFFEVRDEGDGTMLVVDVWNNLGDTGYWGSVAPAAPTGLTLSASSGTLRLGWYKNLEPDIVKYLIERESAEIAQVSGNTLQIVDAGLSNGTTYHYRIRAVNRFGKTSGYSSTAQSYPTPTDNSAPLVPAGLNVFAVSTFSVRVTWSANSDVDMAGYHIYRSTTSNEPSPTKLNTSLVALAQSPYFIDSSVTAGLTYYYRVTAQDASNPPNISSKSVEASAFLVTRTMRVDMGNANPAAVSITGQPYPFSAGISMSKESEGSTVWSVATGQIAGKAMRYRYQTLIGTNSFTEGNFTTTSGDREMTISYQTNQTITDDWEDTPFAPANVRAYSDVNSAWVYWDAAVNSEDVQGYRVYSSSGGLFSPLVASSPYKVTGLNAGQTYTFVVRSVDGGEIVLESSNSSSVAVTPDAAITVIIKTDRRDDFRYKEEEWEIKG